jgi:DNA polymerase-3 subunit gamma/tau
VIFMFATTEMHKVPQTIISRVQKEIMRKITLDDLIGRLADVCNAEGITADRPALEIVARRGEGSVRDALSLLDQVIAFSGRNVSAEDVATVLGLSDTTFFARVVTLISEGDHGGVLEALQEASDAGRDFKMLYRDLMNFVRNLMLVAGGASESMLAVSPEDLPIIQAVAKKFSYTELLRIANLLIRDDETVNKAEHQRLAVEIALLKAATFPRLRSVEEAMAGGASPSPAASRHPLPASGAREKPALRPAERGEGGRRPDEGRGTEDLVAKVKAKRPLIAGYLEGAALEKNGNRITLTFDDSFAAETVGDAKQSIEQIAAELYGESMVVDIKMKQAEPAPSGRRVEDKQPSSLRDDPVLSSFEKHLGAQLVKEKR